MLFTKEKIIEKTIIEPCPHGELLDTIARGSSKYLDFMQESERKSFTDRMSRMYQDKNVHAFLDSISEEIAYLMAKEWRGEQNHEFGRGALNGVDLVRQHLLQLHNEHMENTKPKERFDPYGLISE